MLLPLLRLALEKVKDVQVVLGSHFHTHSVGVCFVQDLVEASVVILQQPPVHHQLDGALLKVSRASLRPIIHYCDLSLLVVVSHHDG